MVGELLHPMEVDSIAIKVAQNWKQIPKVRAMGKFKFHITFFFHQEVKEVMSMELNPLCKLFEEIRRWTSEEVCQIRRV